MTVATLAGIIVLVVDIIDTNIHSADPNALLGRGAAPWVTNVITFSFWFWIFDRGGPESVRRARVSPPASPSPRTRRRSSCGLTGRQYHDYLYLSFTNATAFSPTDTLPLQPWAKMAMMAESVLSLVTAILVIARAINVLPGPA
jgi:hypothetical protein